MPNFDVPILNVTAVSGTTAVLPCTITGIGEKNKVGLLHIQVGIK